MMTATADYLARLDDALRDVPHGVAAEIRAGIAEELSSLQPDAAAQRIRQLGDPLVIAREVMNATAESPSAPQVLVAPAAPIATTSTRGFAIIAALTLGFGGFVVPFIGALAGIVLVAMSTMWRTWEKVVAITVPLVVGALALLSGIAVYATMGEVESVSMTGSGVPAEVIDPLMPTVYDMSWSVVVIVGILLIPASGLWLLWRMRGRTPA